MFGLPSTTSLGLHRRTEQSRERPRRPCATACCGSFGMREIVEPRRVISGVFATYEGNTKLNTALTALNSCYPLLKQRTVSHADTPRHGHGSLPRTEAAPTERTRHASGYGCSRAAQWLLYHRLPDPQLSPVAITPTTGCCIASSVSLQEGSVAASQQRTRLVRVMKHLLEAIG